MKYHNTVLHQLLNFLPRQRFQAVVDRHNGDHRTRSLSCWDQLVSLLFSQLSGRQSLRDLVDSFNSKNAHHYHLGTRLIRRSSLADANRDRPIAIFQETFFYLLEKVRDRLPKQDATELVRLIDATTIDLNMNQFEWAKFRSSKAGIKLHTVYDPHAEIPVFFEMTNAKVNDRKALSSLPMMPGITYVVDRAYNDYGWYYSLTQQGSKFVGRMKSNAVYEVVETRPAKGAGVLADEEIRLTSNKAKKDCPISLRRITFRRAEDQKLLVFISNDLKCSAAEIASLYKQRWQIELFFKWIKQNLKIKKFLGRSENAVHIQVLTAMISYLLLKLVQLGGFSHLSLQQISRLMSVNLTSRRSIHQLLNPETERKIVAPQMSPQLNFGLSFA
ncbi:MAG: IS4 family transposase [Gammaproteobacteria bacterium]|jgi:IS4 transposase|nr:IS4 family transposase [Gammaproteobacteria bacterium]MBT4078346.1 IS4 family transposase [Gammaproteobacteria bacterium]MBT4193008.1 IS4 family transposase [Gammaproteobacteria bacterium]MBT4861104.1 IS4 family transposase [Gammaproteobacteria bacterium]MBT6453940.1 IS4 family transposase [Gammaproteobacteria bacterium]